MIQSVCEVRNINESDYPYTGYAQSVDIMFGGRVLKVGFKHNVPLESLKYYWDEKDMFTHGKAHVVHTEVTLGRRPDYMEVIFLEPQENYVHEYKFNREEAIRIFNDIRG